MKRKRQPINLKKLPEPSEHEIQCAIFRWAALMEREYPELKMLRGSMNGVRLTIGQAVKAKAAGMNKGYPDISLDVARGAYHGLRVELKRKGGKVRPEQGEWQRRLLEQGYCSLICYGHDETIETIINYLEWEI